MRAFHRMRPLIQTPVATLLLIAALAGDYSTLPYNSGVVRFVDDLLPGHVLRCFFYEYEAWMIETDSGLDTWCYVCDPDSRRQGDVIVWVFYDRRSTPHGFWAHTSATERTILGFSCEKEGISDGEVIRTLRQHVATDHEDWPALSDEFDRALEGSKTSDQYTTEWTSSVLHMKPVGIVHDLGALAAFVALCWSFGWVPRWFRLHSRAGRISLGLCPRCRYDISGLSRCPECGELIELEAQA